MFYKKIQMSLVGLLFKCLFRPLVMRPSVFSLRDLRWWVSECPTIRLLSVWVNDNNNYIYVIDKNNYNVAGPAYWGRYYRESSWSLYRALLECWKQVIFVITLLLLLLFMVKRKCDHCFLFLLQGRRRRNHFPCLLFDGHPNSHVLCQEDAKVVSQASQWYLPVWGELKNVIRDAGCTAD